MINNVSKDVRCKISPVLEKKPMKWSIEFDEHLRELIDQQGIDDPHEQWVITGICCVGLAHHQLFGQDTETFDVQEHYFKATKAMKKRLENWL